MGRSIGLVFDRIRWEEKAIIERSKKRGLKMKLSNAKTLCLHAQSQEDFKAIFGDAVLQRCISYFRGFHITAFLESKGIDVINPSGVAQICGNKVLSTLALLEAGVPTPETFIAFSEEGVFKALKEIGYPAVLKPIIGSWGRLVAPLKDKDTTEAIIESRELLSNPLHKIYYIQEMVSRPPRDIRTVVVGDRVVASVYRYSSKEDWRTNVARGGRTEPCPLTKEVEDAVLKAAEAVGGGILGVDAMESPRGILVHEVNNTVEFKGAMAAGATDIPEEILDYAIELVRR
ncbi:MAG: lysine biosynthesis protein LysX [archaeon]|nr:lysine biosynthesis protein LysX [archaeon]MCP8306897.1 lysine biosynthesis protein LysX [archaeon]